MSSEQRTLRDLLTAQARRFGKKPFLISGSEEYSFHDLDDRTDRFATALFRSGLQTGDRIALLLLNRPELVFLLLGASKLGMIPVPLDPAGAQESLRDAVLACGCAGMITESRFEDAARRACAGLPGVRVCLAIDGSAGKEAEFRGFCAGSVLGFWPDIRADQTAAICFSHGGRESPKPVELSHRNLLSNCDQMIRPFRLNETDRVWSSSTLASALTYVFQVLAPLASGASCVVDEAGDDEGVLARLSRGRISIVEGSPEMLEKIARQESDEDSDLSPLRLALSARGGFDSSLFDRFEETHDTLLVEGYGLVEATGLCCVNPYTGVRKKRSVGIPLPGQKCRVVNDRGEALDPGEVGEILVRGPNVMRGYYGDPIATSKSLRDGWLFSGDRGYVDEDGYYYLIR